MSQENSYNKSEDKVVETESPKVELSQTQILEYLKKSEENNAEILKSIKFIRRYYFWRSIFNTLKITLLVVVIVLGVLGWGSIIESFSNLSLDGIQNQLTGMIK